MIKDIFVRASVVARLENSLFGFHLDELATKLQNQHYAVAIINRYLREAYLFGCWLSDINQQPDAINETLIANYLSHVSSGKKSVSFRPKMTSSALKHLLKHLREAGISHPCVLETLPETESQKVLCEYREYLEKVLGLAITTRQKYHFFAERLLNDVCGEVGVLNWSAFTAERITRFIQADAGLRKGFGPHGTATAVRSFLRFLISQGKLNVGMNAAIPTVRRWSHAALPDRLSECEIKQFFFFCLDGSALGRRNFAILMLLSRLGLRAKEVARLQLNDIDWFNGSLLVRAGKTHSERTLPIGQDVGEALLDYVRQGRPNTPHRDIFIEHRAPFRPLQTASAISHIVKRLMVKAGMKRQSSGAHLFRHTAATQMVNRGVSFKEVADVLGHQKLQTTTIYAKLELTALAEVAMPWPGGVQ